MKKRVKIFSMATIILSVLVLFGAYLWNGLFCYIIPWTKTDFTDYQEYMMLLEKHHCLGRFCFINEEPVELTEGNYYWNRKFKEMYAAHSMLLSDEKYLKIIEGRQKFYSETWKGWDNVALYKSQNQDLHYVNESEWFHEELGFVKEVMRNPDALQNYYFLTVVRIDAPGEYRYSGVILNTNSKEIIEFSVELPQDVAVDYQDAWKLQEF